MEFGVFYLPSIGNKQEISQGMAGRRTNLYQRMLGNLAEQAQYLDAHGYYGVAFTEHHFHIEGEEVSTNPILLDMFLGMQTKTMRVGQLGLVLPCQNPLRVAEDVAILDQVTKGRAFAGFARGYQPRWVNTLGQHYDTLRDNATDAERYEALKKELYEEHFEIIMKAWTKPTFSHHGKHWQIPRPTRIGRRTRSPGNTARASMTTACSRKLARCRNPTRSHIRCSFNRSVSPNPP